LLTSSRESEDSARNSNLFVERLPSPSHGQSHDPVRIAEQIKAIADRRVVDHLLLECDPDTPAMAFASLFVPQDDSPHSLGEATRLTTTALALTPSLLLNKLVHRVGMEDPPSPCFLADQLEFVPAIFLEGAASNPDFEIARDIVLTLNPRAQVAELSPISLEAFLLNPGSFDFVSALENAAWRQLIDDQTDRSRDNISAFAYCSRKPFHPERFWNLLQQELPGIFRAKGFFWLATRMDLAGGLNLAGAESYYSAAGNWWAARDDQTRELHMPERTSREWKEPYGDRRQAIAFMGIDLDSGAIKNQLDACLLSDAEMAAGPESWRTFVDPFPSWVHHHHPHDHDHEHDGDCDHAHDHNHDHGSDHPGCCSH
jgi:G3E family GTPase